MLKLGAKSAPAPAETPSEETPTDDTDLDFGGDEAANDTPQDTSKDKGSSEKPFDDTPFDAGVEADEETDPKKFIEQLTGKLGQSLRKYEDDQGQPDFELEKFAINSLLSATHTSEMDAEDQKDIIKKVKTAGKGDGDEESTDKEETPEESPETNSEDSGTEDTTDDSENMFETEQLDEMSLSDYKTKELIDLFDTSDKKTKIIIYRLVCHRDNIIKKSVVQLSVGDILSSGAEVASKPFVGARTASGKIHVNIIYPNKESAITATWGKSTTVGVVSPDRENFIKELHEDIDKEEIEYIFSRLREEGVYRDTENEINEIFEELFVLQTPKKNNMFQEGSNDILDEKDDRCTRIAKRKYDTWPSAYASGAVVKCRQGKIWKDVSESQLDEMDALEEKWSQKYKNSIDCNNPKGFSQRAHCQGKKKHG